MLGREQSLKKSLQTGRYDALAIKAWLVFTFLCDGGKGGKGGHPYQDHRRHMPSKEEMARPETNRQRETLQKQNGNGL